MACAERRGAGCFRSSVLPIGGVRRRVCVAAGARVRFWAPHACRMAHLVCAASPVCAARGPPPRYMRMHVHCCGGSCLCERGLLGAQARGIGRTARVAGRAVWLHAGSAARPRGRQQHVDVGVTAFVRLAVPSGCQRCVGLGALPVVKPVRSCVGSWRCVLTSWPRTPGASVPRMTGFLGLEPLV